MAAPRFRRLNPRDDVAVAVDAARSGDRAIVGTELIELSEDIPAGHKVSLRAIAAGESVVKYGYAIGGAKADIAAGAWVHTHNLRTRLEGTQEYAYRGQASAATGTAAAGGQVSDSAAGAEWGQVSSAASVAAGSGPAFRGYRRADGSVGVRNEIWIVPTVGCVNGIAQRVVEAARARFSEKLADLDGLFAFPHPFGCSQLGDDHETTRAILANLVRHPNAGGVLVLGLGCENNHIESFKKVLGEWDPDRVSFLVAQEAEDEAEEALCLIEALIDRAAGARRTPVPATELIVGMKCGGSDGFSGISANPLVGAFSDRLTGLGGTTILTEVPEMFGAETILMDRAADRTVFDATVKLINDFKGYFLRHGQAVYENPSPGNKEGGITTLEDKSLGCVQKGGSATVAGVHPYGSRVDRGGLQLLSGPGNDIVSLTALAAAGAHLTLFTTGRGTPLGGPVPTVKISSNSDLARRKAAWIDFDAGVLLDASGEEASKAVEDAFFALILDTASGKKTRNEANGYREIAILKDGVTL